MGCGVLRLWKSLNRIVFFCFTASWPRLDYTSASRHNVSFMFLVLFSFMLSSIPKDTSCVQQASIICSTLNQCLIRTKPMSNSHYHCIRLTRPIHSEAVRATIVLV